VQWDSLSVGDTQAHPNLRLQKATQMVSEDIHYQLGDVLMVGRLFKQESTQRQRPGVLVFPEAFGVSDHTYAAARRLADLGYVALACDLHGNAYFRNVADAEMLGRYEQLVADQQRRRAIALSGLKVLQARNEVDRNRIGAVGYCFGGDLALELAFTGAPLVAVAAFHPGFAGITLADASRAKARLLLCVGSNDPFAPTDVRNAFEKALEGAGVDWQMNLYGGVRHSFTNPAPAGPPGVVGYDAHADRNAWQSLVQLFAETCPLHVGSS
jgi:dienelactone hydrolase